MRLKHLQVRKYSLNIFGILLINQRFLINTHTHTQTHIYIYKMVEKKK